MSKNASSATSEAVAIVINGERREMTPGDTVETFLRGQGLDPDVVVVERNGGIVPRKAFAVTVLDPGDELEVVHFVGGG
ncbi:MAG: sulfur carrier protein ThiS [Gemmatimonadota bacterium]